MSLRGISTSTFRETEVVRIFLRKCEPHRVLEDWDEWLTCQVGPAIGPNGERVALGILGLDLAVFLRNQSRDLDELAVRTCEAFGLSEREGQALRVLEEARAEEAWWSIERDSSHITGDDARRRRTRGQPDPHWRDLDGTPLPLEEQQKRREAELDAYKEKFGRTKPCEFSHGKWKRLRRIGLMVKEIAELELALLRAKGQETLYEPLYRRISKAVESEAPHGRQRKAHEPAAATPTATACARCGKTDTPLEKFKKLWLCQECIRLEPSTKDEQAELSK